MSQKGRVVVARAVKQNTLTVHSHQIVTCVDLRWGGGGGRTFEPSRKKMNFSPQGVEVKSGSIYNVKTGAEKMIAASLLRMELCGFAVLKIASWHGQCNTIHHD